MLQWHRDLQLTYGPTTSTDRCTIHTCMIYVTSWNVFKILYIYHMKHLCSIDIGAKSHTLQASFAAGRSGRSYWHPQQGGKTEKEGSKGPQSSTCQKMSCLVNKKLNWIIPCFSWFNSKHVNRVPFSPMGPKDAKSELSFSPGIRCNLGQWQGSASKSHRSHHHHHHHHQRVYPCI